MALIAFCELAVCEQFENVKQVVFFEDGLDLTDVRARAVVGSDPERSLPEVHKLVLVIVEIGSV